MVVNDDAGLQDNRGVFEPIASRLAPTGRTVREITRALNPHPP